MKNFIRGLSDRSEFIIVIGLAFGYPIVSSLYVLLSGAYRLHITQSHLQMLFVYEISLFIILGYFLNLRNWRPDKLGLEKFNWLDPLVAVGLMLLADAFYWVLWFSLVFIYPGFVKHIHQIIAPGLHLPSVIVVSILNAAFEEVFVCAYVIEALKPKRGIKVAVIASILIRYTYHLYQGVLSLFSALPIGIIFAIWYARKRRLWPLIMAHALIDILAMLRFLKH